MRFRVEWHGDEGLSPDPRDCLDGLIFRIPRMYLTTSCQSWNKRWYLMNAALL